MTSPGAGELETRLASLQAPVRLVLFTQTFGCDTCLPARQVVDHIAAVSEYISVEEHNLVLDKDNVAEFGVDRVPAIAVVGDTDLGIRYYGVPAGYELGSIVDAVLLAGSGEHALTADSLAKVEAIERPVDIKVFVTPT
jgi:alkyl hydroperoxide reductase subunit AhpF